MVEAVENAVGDDSPSSGGGSCASNERNGCDQIIFRQFLDNVHTSLSDGNRVYDEFNRCDPIVFGRFLDNVREYSLMAERCRFGYGLDPSWCSRWCCDCPTTSGSQNSLVSVYQECQPKKSTRNTAGPSRTVHQKKNNLET